MKFLQPDQPYLSSLIVHVRGTLSQSQASYSEHRPSLLTYQRPPNSELSKADNSLPTTYLLPEVEVAKLTTPNAPNLSGHTIQSVRRPASRAPHCIGNHSRHSDTTDSRSLSADMRPRRQLGALLQRYAGPITAARSAGLLDVALLS